MTAGPSHFECRGFAPVWVDWAWGEIIRGIRHARDSMLPVHMGSRRPAGLEITVMFAAAILILLAARPEPVHAHYVTPEEVIQSLTATGTRQKFDITEVQRSTDMARLLVIRVGRGWSAVYPTRRVIAAEEWYQLWRDAVPNGVLAIVDDSDRPLVNFDPEGHATLRDVPSSPPATP